MSGDEQLSQLVSVTAKLGPRNIPKIARSLSIPVETARHRLRKQLLSRGIGIQACIDYSKLGLQRSWLMLDFTEEFKGRESKSATALAQVAYLVSYFKTIPDDRFVAQVAIPHRLPRAPLDEKVQKRRAHRRGQCLGLRDLYVLPLACP